MDRLVLNIPKLEETIAQTNKMLTEIKAAGKTVSEANKKLTANGTWQGGGADAYKDKAEQLSKDLMKHEIAVSRMKDAMKAALSQAENLNRQALGFAGFTGGAASGGAKNILTYDPIAKTSAINACDRAISQIDLQLSQVKKAQDALAGVSGFAVSPELSTYHRTLNDRKNKLNKLRQAITNYAASAESFVSTAIRVFGGVE